MSIPQSWPVVCSVRVALFFARSSDFFGFHVGTFFFFLLGTALASLQDGNSVDVAAVSSLLQPFRDREALRASSCCVETSRRGPGLGTPRQHRPTPVGRG